MKLSSPVISHLGMLGVGIALAAILHSSGILSGKRESDPIPNSGNQADGAGNSKGTAKAARGKFSRSDAYRSAWAALAKEPLDRRARFTAQTTLLAEWADVDLDAALEAFLGEAWDSAGRDYWRNPLEEAFGETFANQPLISWQALQRQPMAKHLLANVWVSAAFPKEPKLVISMLGELPPEAQSRSLSMLASEVSVLPDRGEELLKKLALSGTSTQVEDWMSQFFKQSQQSGEPGPILEQWSAMPDSGQRIRQMAAWANSLSKLNSEQLAIEWQDVPEADREQALRMLLAQVDSASPALLGSIDLAIAQEKWGALKDGIGQKLRNSNADPDTLAEWALALPQRNEIRNIFALAISPKLVSDPVAGRQWLESLPPGEWHRENGFAAMATGLLRTRGDAETAQQAIDSITDATVRKGAIKSRYDWEIFQARPKMSLME